MYQIQAFSPRSLFWLSSSPLSCFPHIEELFGKVSRVVFMDECPLVHVEGHKGSVGDSEVTVSPRLCSQDPAAGKVAPGDSVGSPSSSLKQVLTAWG